MAPPLKRDAERRRRNVRPEAEKVALAPVQIPEPNEDWHPIALGWYRALVAGPHAGWTIEAEWWAAQYVADAMSRSLSQREKFSSELFKGVIKAFDDLLVTESARRRARLEVARADQVKPHPVSILDDYRDAR